MVMVLAGAAACGGSSGSSSKSSGLPGIRSTSPAVSADESDSTTATLEGLDYCSLLNPAALASAGIHNTKGQLPADSPYVLGCWWAQGDTLVSLSVTLGAQVHDLDKGERQDFSGFEGATQYDDINSECFVDVNIGLDQFRVDTANSARDNKALTGKKCDVAVQLARQVVAKVKK
jgi:hypothetical protein